MVGKEIKELADLFVQQTASLELPVKTAARARITRKQMMRDLEKAKVKHKKLKEAVDIMDAQDSKLRTQLDSARKDLNQTRSSILTLHNALQGMDLSNADDVVFYDDSQVGYVINGKEYHLNINEEGELSLMPMRAHRKSLRLKDEPVEDETLDMAPSEDEELPGLENAVDPSEEEELLKFLDAEMDE